MYFRISDKLHSRANVAGEGKDFWQKGPIIQLCCLIFAFNKWQKGLIIQLCCLICAFQQLKWEESQ